MISLLDVNVLIALFDEAHVHHTKAHHWFAETRVNGWASCPLTQNGCLRIISQPAYPMRLAIADIARRIDAATSASDHHFWNDDISLCDPALFNHQQILASRYLTDIYLLGLAVKNGGRLVTWNR